MDIRDCMTTADIRVATHDDEYLGILSEHVLHGWSSTQDEAQKELLPYWSFRDEITIIHGITMHGKTTLLQDITLQLDPRNMGIQKTTLLACESIYWVNMNTSTDKTKITPHAFISSHYYLRIKQCHRKYQGGHGYLLG